MTVDQLTLPDAVRSQANDILTEIEQAEGVLELSRLGGMAEGFALGLSCGAVLPADQVQALEALFTQGIGRRMNQLRNA